MSSKPHKTTEEKFVQLVVIAVPLFFAYTLVTTCQERKENNNIEMKGIGMLEAKGFYGELPPEAGKHYYQMLEDRTFSSEEYQTFFWEIRAYQNSRMELRKRGLSNSDMSEIPESALYDAMRANDPKKALDDLAKQYD